MYNNLSTEVNNLFNEKVKANELNFMNWNVLQVFHWFKLKINDKTKGKEYWDNILKNMEDDEVTGKVLSHVTKSDLKDLGFKPLLVRSELFKNLKELIKGNGNNEVISEEIEGLQGNMVETGQENSQY